MDKNGAFEKSIADGYTFKGSSVILGGAILDGKPIDGLQVKAPLKMFNRHGLIAGATGTGKTKTLQGIAELLSDSGVSTLVMDIKGDLSGLSQPGNPHPKVDERHKHIGTEWVPTGFPIEFLTLSAEKGVRLRATISEFGPVLLSKMLELNDTQQGVISLVFKYCDDRKLPLLDIEDLRTVLKYISSDGKAEVQKEYGLVSSSSIGAIMRKLLELEQQGADVFFGERSFDVEDLVRLDQNGRGYINAIRLIDIQNKPKLFSSFMLCLLAEVYEKFPERGDMDRPELVIFIDEAHLIFQEASKALLSQIETIVKLIRSKGVGIFFCTQNPGDVPDAVLSQLGMKVQHALRAFTAKDRTEIKKVAQNYPLSDFYEVDQTLTALGIGEAFITLLNEKGIPTPLVHCLLNAPRSRMDVISEGEMDQLLKKSVLIHKYNADVDRDSAHEMLERKMNQAALEEKNMENGSGSSGGSTRRTTEKSTFEQVMRSPVANTIVRELTRGILGIFNIKTTGRRR
jgi:DNA helicase HerA-like ATPase